MGLATGLSWPGLPGKAGGTLGVSRARTAAVLSLLGCRRPAHVQPSPVLPGSGGTKREFSSPTCGPCLVLFLPLGLLVCGSCPCEGCSLWLSRSERLSSPVVCFSQKVLQKVAEICMSASPALLAHRAIISTSSSFSLIVLC